MSEHASVGLTQSGAQQAAGILFQKADGREFGLRYANLLYVDFESKEDIDLLWLFFSTHHVTLKGSGLRGLVREFLEQQVRLVREAPRAHAAAARTEGLPVVTSIAVTLGGGGETPPSS